MIQIFRTSSKPEIYLCIRRYGTQRYQLNYYDILKIPQNSTQKDIRNAFIKLSKKHHPDINGKGDHKDFVKLNEAYTVLSKENTRRDYDMFLENRVHSSTFNYRTASSDNCNEYNYYYHNPHRSQYANRRQWEEQMARGAWTPPSPSYFGGFSLHKWVICFVSLILLITFQMAIYHRLVTVKKHMARQQQYQKEYNEMKEKIKNLTREEELLLIQNKIAAIESEKIGKEL